MPKNTLSDRLSAETFALDMAGLRALANRVLTRVDEGARFTRTVVSYGVDVPGLCPLTWPHDTAADLLAAWRAA